jgi:guanosine-3',5'-bis(diphosphate) 3'-pyrophosphohydrolase
VSVPGQLLTAVAYAAEQHRLQRRKGLPVGDDTLRTPYINHPITVAELLTRIGGIDDVSTLCAAILHDTIEDTDTTESDLRTLFGDTITDIVLEVTDDRSLPKQERKRMQVVHAPDLSPPAKALKLADKISNLRDLIDRPPDWSQSRIREYFDWAKRVVDGLGPSNPGLEAMFAEVYAQKP